jgi:hypothetical protein
MGLFYANLTVVRSLRQPLVSVLRRLRRTAFLSPTVYGHTVIYDRTVDEQNPETIERFGCHLSQHLSCAALAAALHDDDVLYLWLFKKGKVLDHYDSLPGYFDPNAEPGSPTGMDSKLLSEAFGRPDIHQRVEALLRANLLDEHSRQVSSELERHQALADALGMPPFAVGLGYAAISDGYVPERFQAIEFTKVD